LRFQRHPDVTGTDRDQRGTLKTLLFRNLILTSAARPRHATRPVAKKHASPKERENCSSALNNPSSRSPIIAAGRLIWHERLGKKTLHLDRNPQVLIELIPNGEYTGMFRLKHPNGHISDRLNLTRARDAAISVVLASLNGCATRLAN
jgi:hypothetical protein